MGCVRLGAPMRQVLQELGVGGTRPGIRGAGLAGVALALSWHGPSLYPPTAGSVKLPAWTPGGMGWDVPGMQGSPRAIWTEAAPRRASEDQPWRVWGRGGFSSRRSLGLGGQEPICSPLPLSVTASSWAAPSVRREGIRATAPGKGPSPRPPRAPRRGEGASGSSGWPGAWVGGRRFQRGHRLPPSFWPGPPGPLHRTGGHTSRVDIPPSCPWRPAAFVFLGLHKMAAAALRHFVCEAGRRAGGPAGEEGGRPLPARLPRVAWTEPSTSPRPSPALAAAALGLAPAHVLARPSGNPGPSPSLASPLAAPQTSLTSRRRCCEAEPRRAIIKAMLLEGVLGSHRAGMDGSRNDAHPSGWGWAPQTMTGPGLF